MTNGKTLCLNMIVKNEMANLERCLVSVANHIHCWVIGDTGSTDGTPDFVMAFFAERGVPGELHSFPFDNFEQARNAALDHAYASPLAYDYLLFCDADMELVVDETGFREQLTAPGYRLLQRTDGGLTYWNTRLARRDAGARYHGVTHEYVDVPGGVEQLHGVWYKDHASGSNRTDKFERDIALLTKALETEPGNQRYWFYLAQSLKDAGRTAEAAETYAKRAAMGGWEEEAWYAQMMQARCLRDLGDEGGFLREALAAYNRRPQRAEPLYDLARHYRDRSMNDTSVLFSEAGLAIPRPAEDVLFLEDFVYAAGLKEEYSIGANYARDKARKDRGFAACNWLALSRDVPAAQRNLARSNLYYYIEPASALLPSFAAQQVAFTPPEGYRPSNPSVASDGNQLLLVQRTVNYTVTADREYHTAKGEPVHTRNFLLRLNDELEIQSSAEILPPVDMPEPRCTATQGFEDLRLFFWRGGLWCSACVRELTPEGWCEQILARIHDSEPGPLQLTDWHVLCPDGPRLHEKNWMPQVSGERLQFIYRCDPTRLLDDRARMIRETTPPIAAENFCGGSQAIIFAAGRLALVHEARVSVASGSRNYRHRFVWFDDAGLLRGVTRPFSGERPRIRRGAGLASRRQAAAGLLRRGRWRKLDRDRRSRRGPASAEGGGSAAVRIARHRECSR
jgi:glycosyltransferase involved in cell wall biosynthesis